MFTLVSMSTVIFVYLIALFLVGYLGDKYLRQGRQHPIIYSLALGVHCSSWAFFGTTTQATQYGWAFVPTYLGIILVMLLGFGAMKKMAEICQRNNISSLADFIGVQYNSANLLAAIVSLLCFIGVVPYVALQLDSVVDSLTLLTNESSTRMGLYVAVVLAVLAIFLGARSFDLTDKKPGLMLTVAFASSLKLIALSFVGIFVCYELFNGIFDLMGKAQLSSKAQQVLQTNSGMWVYISHVFLGICAMFCLPRQFHVNFVEYKSNTELNTARWLFPLFLVGMGLFVLPIGLAGHILFDKQDVSTDIYALALPLKANSALTTLVSFVGGLAAATSMVVVATLAVGIMISNNLITPVWVKFKLINQNQNNLSPSIILFIRRLTIASVLAVSYFYHKDVSSGSPLVNSGIIAMALLAQTFPMMLLGLYWQKSNKLAAYIGLLVGSAGWFYWLLWPSITSSYYFDPTPTDLELGRGFIFSLLANGICFCIIAWCSPTKPVNQANHPQNNLPQKHPIKLSKLLALTQNVLNEDEIKGLKSKLGEVDLNSFASMSIVESVEGMLAAKIGGASSRILISAIAEKDEVPITELVEWMEEAAQTFQFNHEILQSSVEHIQQGISVIDPELKLIAWNQRYIEMFDYPEGYIHAGISMRKILAFNAQRGLFGSIENPQQEIDKRIEYIKQGSIYKYVRKQPNGQVIELNGGPLPGGGFVTTYSDITEYMEIQQQLELAKSQLERRVDLRTEELKHSNQALTKAKLLAERANESKTKFLAAAGHDLMQPFNAASLFGELIQQKSNEPEIKLLSQSLNDSINNAEELLSLLLDMTKLESGVLESHIQEFPIDDVLSPLFNDFNLIAQRKKLNLIYVPSSAVVVSDKKLLKRIIQNLLSNAIRYTQSGKIVMGCRRNKQHIKVCVLDTGPGISTADQHHIFEEFRQLDKTNIQQGLGLGLTIVDRVSSLLNHPIQLQSQLGKGSNFSVSLPLGKRLKNPVKTADAILAKTEILHARTVLLAENDPQTREAVVQLLESWEAKVITVENLSGLEKVNANEHIDLMLLDYHLDHQLTGLDIAENLRKKLQYKVPGILNSSDRSDIMRENAQRADLLFLPKPLKSAALKRMLRKIGWAKSE
ncbi:PAS-domain containing protein [Aliiglaciecola sp. SL4]|uniref:PAS domain-containing hybrid sensor histidine kinase/response regulator n=1 Tax=Aliiglaciecola sp. SL4 TaxID=3239806 RepID=UPI00355C39A0